MDWMKWVEKNRVPDKLLRLGIRRELADRLEKENRYSVENSSTALQQWIETLKQSPITLNTQEANAQHYEVPTQFYERVLGKYLKYSSGYWQHTKVLSEAEEAMLVLTCERAQLQDGQRILELGCGWGSLTLWMAEHYPNAKITAVSNSKTQKDYIDLQAQKRHLTNIDVVTADIATYVPLALFDRIVSVEMLEHVRNYQQLFERISQWLVPNGLFFVHVFVNFHIAYPFESENSWMAKHFFTGGQMPSDALFLYFQDHLKIKQHWKIEGTHYQKTCEAWLYNLDVYKDQILIIFEHVYGAKEALKRWVYWRLFFMACAELFGYNKGQEWGISHYLFEKH